MLTILQCTSPIEIGIYGSYARGDYKASSDIDMYVLYNELPPKIQKGDLYEEAAEMGIDLLICDYRNFYETDSVFCKNVLRDQKILWQKEASYES